MTMGHIGNESHKEQPSRGSAREGMFLMNRLPAQLAGNPIAEQQQRRGTAANKGGKRYRIHGSILYQA